MASIIIIFVQGKTEFGQNKELQTSINSTKDSEIWPDRRLKKSLKEIHNWSKKKKNNQKFKISKIALYKIIYNNNPFWFKTTKKWTTLILKEKARFNKSMSNRLVQAEINLSCNNNLNVFQRAHKFNKLNNK